MLSDINNDNKIINARGTNSQSRSINNIMPTLLLHCIATEILIQYKAIAAVSILPGKTTGSGHYMLEKRLKATAVPTLLLFSMGFSPANNQQRN